MKRDKQWYTGLTKGERAWLWNIERSGWIRKGLHRKWIARLVAKADAARKLVGVKQGTQWVDADGTVHSGVDDFGDSGL